jgi:hypothetical protein
MECVKRPVDDYVVEPDELEKRAYDQLRIKKDQPQPVPA